MKLLFLFSFLIFLFLTNLALAANNTLFSDDFESQTLNAWNQTYSSGWGILSHNGSYVANESVSYRPNLIIDDSNIPQYNLTGKFYININELGTDPFFLVLRGSGYAAVGVPSKYILLQYSIAGGGSIQFTCYYNNGSGNTGCADNPVAVTLDSNYQDFYAIADNNNYSLTVNGTKVWNSTITGFGYTNSTISFSRSSGTFRIDNIVLQDFGNSNFSSILNNYTNNDSLAFTVLQNKNINFSVVPINIGDYYNWSVSNTSIVSNGTSLSFNHTFNKTGVVQINLTSFNASLGTFLNLSWNLSVVNYPFQLLSPANTSSGINPNNIALVWREWPLNAPYTYQIATDNQFISIVASGSGITHENETITSSATLDTNTEYFWRVKNNTDGYINWFSFNTSLGVITPGLLNITVHDESNTSNVVSNFTINLYNSTSYLTKSSNASGWVNFTAEEVSSGEYLIIAVPNSSYYQRMVLATSPANVTMYLPNASNTIDLVYFSLLDVTGLFPYSTSTISILRGGLLQDKSYFPVDGNHPVYLIQGLAYQIQIQNGDNIFNSNNFVPYASGTSQVTINNFVVNTTTLNPFIYNITYDSSEIVLNWNDVGGVMSTINYVVYRGDPLVSYCTLTTTINHGQSSCSITNTTQYRVVFSALMNDGTFQNNSFFVDYRGVNGVRTNNTGTSPITNEPMGTGFLWDYGTWHTPNWVYNWASLIVIIIMAGSFGGYYSGFGAIITLIVALLLEWNKLFRPLGQDNTVTMGITGGFLFLAIIYFLQHKDRGV